MSPLTARKRPLLAATLLLALVCLAWASLDTNARDRQLASRTSPGKPGPRTALAQVQPEDVWQNTTTITPGVSSLNVTLNVSRFNDPGPTNANVTGNVTLLVRNPSGSQVLLQNISFLVGALWGYEYAPIIADGLVPGVYSFRFYIYNATTFEPLNQANLVDGNFIVGASAPAVTVDLSATRVCPGDTITATITVADFDSGYSWTVNFFDPAGTLILTNTTSPTTWYYTFAANYATEGNHHVEVEATDGTHVIQENHSVYVVIPRISIDSVAFGDAPSTLPTFYRMTGSLNVTASLSLATGASNIEFYYDPFVALYTTMGGSSTTPRVFNLSYVSPGLYSFTLSYSAADPAGIYSCWLEVRDQLVGRVERSQVYEIRVLNHAPAVNNVTVNGQNVSSQLTVTTGQQVNCSIAASDTENDLAYYGVDLFGPDNEFILNFTIPHSAGQNVLIDTSELPAGLYVARFFAADADGAKGYYDSEIYIRVRGNAAEVAFPYVMLVVGVVVGVGIGIAFLWRKNQALKQELEKQGGVVESKRRRKKNRKKKASKKAPEPAPEPVKSEEKEKDKPKAPKKDKKAGKPAKSPEKKSDKEEKKKTPPKKSKGKRRIKRKIT